MTLRAEISVSGVPLDDGLTISKRGVYMKFFLNIILINAFIILKRCHYDVQIIVMLEFVHVY
jgi:hypothetical protein